MESLSPMHLLIIAAVIIILFGGKKIPEVMKGLGEGVRSFKEGMRGDTQATAPPPSPAAAPVIAPPPPPTEEKK
jgi:sec-independent protein translocase protein TatA